MECYVAPPRLSLLKVHGSWLSAAVASQPTMPLSLTVCEATMAQLVKRQKLLAIEMKPNGSGCVFPFFSFICELNMILIIHCSIHIHSGMLVLCTDARTPFVFGHHCWPTGQNSITTKD